MNKALPYYFVMTERIVGCFFTGFPQTTGFKQMPRNNRFYTAAFQCNVCNLLGFINNNMATGAERSPSTYDISKWRANFCSLLFFINYCVRPGRLG